MVQNGQLQLINTEMQKDSYNGKQAFLQKFEGKKNVISRQGLLHILELKRQSFSQTPNPHIPNKKTVKQINKYSSKQIVAPTSLIKKIQQSKDKSKSEVRLKHSSSLQANIQGHYIHRNQLKQPKRLQVLNNGVKLPTLNKSSSHSSSIHKQCNDLTYAQSHQTSDKKSIKSLSCRLLNPSGSNINHFRSKMQLDQYALRHLEFLDKFQRQIQKNQFTGKQTARSYKILTRI